MGEDCADAHGMDATPLAPRDAGRGYWLGCVAGFAPPRLAITQQGDPTGQMVWAIPMTLTPKCDGEPRPGQAAIHQQLLPSAPPLIGFQHSIRSECVALEALCDVLYPMHGSLMPLDS